MAEEDEFDYGFTVWQVKDACPDLSEEKIARFLEVNADEICKVMGEAGWNYIVNNIRREEFYDE